MNETPSTTTPKCIRVLCVEDDPCFYEEVKGWLESYEGPHTFKAERAATLAESDEVIARFDPDVILLDTHLRNGAGTSTIQRMILKTNQPIIVLSAYSYGEFGIDALRAGAKDYLHKGDVGKTGVIRSILFTRELCKSRRMGTAMLEAASGIRKASKQLNQENNPTCRDMTTEIL